MVSKKGLSPVIASVLLILLVLVLAAIIFLWARGFIGEQIEKFGKPMDVVCESVDFDIMVADSSGLGHSLEIVNRGSIGIGAFDFKIYSGGNSEVVRIDTGVPAFGSLDVNVDLQGVFESEVDNVEVFPVLKGTIVSGTGGGYFACQDSIYLEGF